MSTSLCEKASKIVTLVFSKVNRVLKKQSLQQQKQQRVTFFSFVTFFGQNGQTVDNYILKSKMSYFCYYCKILR